MRFPLFIVIRSLLDKRNNSFLSFISVTSIFGIALGVAILIIALSVLSGFEKSIKTHLINLNAHITVSGFGSRNLDVNNEDLLAFKKKFEHIKSISPFIKKNTIIKHGKFSEGISLEALNPENDNSKLRDYIIKGKYNLNYSKDFYPILIGEKLADKLLIKVGDKVTIFTLQNNKLPSIDNPPLIENFRVTGIYRSGMAEFDDLKAYTNLYLFQNITGMRDQISGFYIKVDSLKNISTLTAELSDYLGYPFYVRSFYKTHQHIFTWLELQKKPVPIILGLIILVAAFNIIGTLLMNVIQQTKKIGVLKILGTESKVIQRIYLLQGFFLAITGIVAGNIFALVLTYLQNKHQIISLPSQIYFISDVPLYVDFYINLIVSVITLFFSLSVSILPSRIASRISPITAVRFD